MSGWELLGDGLELAFELVVDLFEASDPKKKPPEKPRQPPRTPPEDCA